MPAGCICCVCERVCVSLLQDLMLSCLSRHLMIKSMKDTIVSLCIKSSTNSTACSLLQETNKAMTWLMAEVHNDTCNVQVVMMTGGEVQCPISLDTNPLCPQITPCGHVFAFHSIMQHLMTQVTSCLCLLFQWLINQGQGAVCNADVFLGMS